MKDLEKENATLKKQLDTLLSAITEDGELRCPDAAMPPGRWKDYCCSDCGECWRKFLEKGGE